MNKQQLKIDTEPKRLVILSDPYVIFYSRRYQPVIDVIDAKRKREYFIYVSSKSISEPLESMRENNNGSIKGLEIWIRKNGTDRFAQYVVE